jgi:hypothetical protein
MRPTASGAVNERKQTRRKVAKEGNDYSQNRGLRNAPIGRDARLQRDSSIMFDHLEPGEPNAFFFPLRLRGQNNHDNSLCQ